VLLLDGLSDDDIVLIRKGAAAALQQPMAVAEGFYRRVFAARPGLRALFPSDLRPQQHKLVQTIAVLLETLDRIDDLEELLRRLGAAHRWYGAKAAHYPIVNQALLDTLAETGGVDFTPAHRRAWTQLLTFVAQAMLRGAEE
jgi:hemoglobin-like flavoprotein